MNRICVAVAPTARAKRWDGTQLVDDSNSLGISDCGRSAIAWARSLAAPTTHILVIAVGGQECLPVLRDALALGVSCAIHLDTETSQLNQNAVATLIAEQARDADLVLCGDRETSGLVGPLVAAILGIPCVCGALSVARVDGGFEIRRRLDGGRREDLLLSEAGVVAVEAGLEPPRASLPTMLRAQHRQIDRIDKPEAGTAIYTPIPWVGPPAWIEPPAGDAHDRIQVLTGNRGNAGRVREELTCDPEEAARRIHDALTEWGYLPFTRPE